MRKKLMIITLLIASLTGCDKIKDATTIDIDTTLNTNIPVTVTGKKSISDLTTTGFSVSKDLNLAENADISDYLSKINSINLSNVVITISGLTADQVINSITLDVAGIGTIFTQSNITMSANQFSPDISAAILTQMAAKLMSDKKLTFSVTGTTNGAMTFTASCGMDATLKVSAI